MAGIDLSPLVGQVISTCVEFTRHDSEDKDWAFIAWYYLACWFRHGVSWPAVGARDGCINCTEGTYTVVSSPFVAALHYLHTAQTCTYAVCRRELLGDDS